MNQYSALDKTLHRQFLGGTILSQYLYQRLLDKSTDYPSPSNNQHLFITGLARAGTTALLNQLYSTSLYASICYKHAPFVLSPRLATLASAIPAKNLQPYERYHGDGILISANSPECLDEPYWIKSDPSYYLAPLSSRKIYDSSVLRGYDYLLDQYARAQHKNFTLVKNNNNHVRLPQLVKHFPKSTFLVLFRHPVAHIASLCKAHHTFLRLHEQDQFISEYMKLFGHREFGFYRCKFSYEVEDQAFESKINIHSTISDPNYFLDQWLRTHTWFLNSSIYDNHNVFCLCYELLCKEPSYLEILFKQLRIHSFTRTFRSSNAEIPLSVSGLDKYRLNDALNIYDKLLNYSSI
ncbi:P-loop containing nucleoside triphosphate hydrolase [Synechococcus sp. Minos11]|uniref:sulfotransferase n=1 Tax=Synechococcus sp. Minos11 TaxID=221341 RepID=UPI0016489D56|nr:sulfotransferase [Synechococcus sp. Minos11]QNJ08135.1 P-loop containing nucleoside triphosphate hydrolase [Synechococcus sp. Minos11]